MSTKVFLLLFIALFMNIATSAVRAGDNIACDGFESLVDNRCGNCLTKLAATNPPLSILDSEPLDDVIREPVLCYTPPDLGEIMLWDDNLIHCDDINGPTRLYDETGYPFDFGNCSEMQEYLSNHTLGTCNVVVYHDVQGGIMGLYPGWVTAGGFMLTPRCRQSILDGETVP